MATAPAADKNNVLGQENNPSEKKPAKMEWIKSQAKKTCTKEQLHRKLPICEWLPKYNSEKAVSDLLAGITVGLTVIPQGIAYAVVAKLPPQVNSSI